MHYPKDRTGRRSLWVTLLAVLVLILGFLVRTPSQAQSPSLQHQNPAGNLSQATTVIVVDTSEDLDSSSTRKTCTYTSGA
ncbi:MAG: hypothetical protein EOM24_15580, partial [Chloroflexia bacterium]|nr:hypothetical protein [Chloroflexia bacterium]